MNICLVGEGAFAIKHLEAINNIEDAQVTSIVGGVEAATNDVATKYHIPFATPMHAAQALEAMRQGKHVLIEIPFADSLADANAVCAAQKETGLIAMAGHTRRFNPSHQWIHNKIQNRELNIQHLDVQTFFFRRQNLNALGEPRSWTDHLLWHHACHTVDLFAYQTGEEISEIQAMQGPVHPELGIAMDMSIGLKTASGALCTLALSFNNDGPFGTFFRYICDNGTYIARYDDLVDGREKPIDVSNIDVSLNGIELEDREFFNAIRENREPNGSIHQTLAAMKVLDLLEKALSKNSAI